MNFRIKSLFKKSSQTFFIRLLGVLLNYIFLLTISNKYNASGMGVFAYYQSLLLIFSILPQFGINTSIIRFISEVKKDVLSIKKILIKCIIISISISLVFTCFIYTFNDLEIFLKNDNINLSFYFIISVLPFVIMNILSEVCRALGKVKLFILYKYSLLPLIAFIIISFSDYTISPINSYIISIYIILFLSILSVLFILFRMASSNYSETTIEEKYTYNYIFRISFPMLISGSILLLMGNIDSFMIGIFSNNIADVGIYNIAVRISTVTSIILFSVNSFVAPRISELYSNNNYKELNNIIKNSTRIIFIFTIPFVCLFIFAPKYLLSFFGNDFIIGYKALIILSIGQFINAFSGSVGYIMQLTNHEKQFQNIVFIALLINILLNILLIPLYSMNGAAFASMISLVFWNLSCIIYIRKTMNIKTYFSLFNEN